MDSHISMLWRPQQLSVTVLQPTEDRHQVNLTTDCRINSLTRTHYCSSPSYACITFTDNSFRRSGKDEKRNRHHSFGLRFTRISSYELILVQHSAHTLAFERRSKIFYRNQVEEKSSSSLSGATLLCFSLVPSPHSQLMSADFRLTIFGCLTRSLSVCSWISFALCFPCLSLSVCRGHIDGACYEAIVCEW